MSRSAPCAADAACSCRPRPSARSATLLQQDRCEPSARALPVYALGAVVVFDEAVRVAATSVVVRGSNASVALAGGATRLFEVTSGGALRLENLALRGGAPSLGDGGAVAVEGGSLLVLVDCVVSDSTAGGSTTTGGGGVAVEGVLFLSVA